MVHRIAARALGSVAALTLFAASAPAATTLVTTRFDDPDLTVAGATCDPHAGPLDCSLRGAIAAAHSGDTITLAAGTYRLTLGELAATAPLTITGAGMTATTIAQTGTGGAARVIDSGFPL